jgi:hypothetical protein
MVFCDNAPDFFALYADPDTDQLIEENESLEDPLRDHTGQSIKWTSADFHRVSNETAIPDVYLRAVECPCMRVDAHGLAWTCYPKHLDLKVRTNIIPWELLEGQRLFAPSQTVAERF